MGEKRYAGLDYFRLISALLIVSIHTFPLLSISPEANFFLTHVLARVAVPFFLMTTGFFLVLGKTTLNGFIKKTALLYGAAILLYLPVNIYTGAIKQQFSPAGIFKGLVFEGTFYHLWYLPASILGVIIVCGLYSKLKPRVVLGVTMLLYLLALLGDSYYGISEQFAFLNRFYNVLFIFFDHTRNGLLMTPVFIALGGAIAAAGRQYSNKICLTGLSVAAVLLLAEGSFLNRQGMQRHDSMYIMLLPVMFFLFHLLLNCRGKAEKKLRTLSMLIYIVHPMCIIVVRGFAKAVNLTELLIDNSMLHFIAVLSISILCSVIVMTFLEKKDRGRKADRAWVEIDLEGLENNIGQFRKILPESCGIMAVVKANAYGHGDVEISRELNNMGVNAFAVATVKEGIRLRKNGIRGEILILGYTLPDEVSLLKQYDLTQTVVDLSYARMLNSRNKKIKVHVKIDTGMHRLGESFDNMDNLTGIFQCGNLLIRGTFSHLSAADSLAPEDVKFTHFQIERFYKTLDRLKEAGFNPGKIHLQSSYGVLNYPYLKCDYARTGIAMYGVLSSREHETRVPVLLQPVLSMKARVILTKEIGENERIGYGHQCISGKKTRLAVISVGYADGIPSNLSCGKGQVIINGRKAGIVGRICMDQLMVDVTDIPGTRQGDIATLIGHDGNEFISAESVAAQAGTLTNELLSRLGVRVPRNIINNRTNAAKSRVPLNLKNTLSSWKFSIKSS
ncbi:serine racemase VanT catalytic subunit [Ruminiclostridium cellobioparum]|uniref:Alanine racemase n=1 Tax=Ruminiclostridium cellobioparum subsp. termitidis CT1112 TaxID=1195236 RepID=S0FMN8_RUMCE|nr:alanine racemase [Ruminiclostridium cellobioparum subsp. termitidis CT1112]